MRRHTPNFIQNVFIMTVFNLKFILYFLYLHFRLLKGPNEIEYNLLQSSDDTWDCNCEDFLLHVCLYVCMNAQNISYKRRKKALGKLEGVFTDVWITTGQRHSLLRRTLNVKGSQNELHKLPGNMTPFINWWRLQHTLKGYPFIIWMMRL